MRSQALLGLFTGVLLGTLAVSCTDEPVAPGGAAGVGAAGAGGVAGSGGASGAGAGGVSGSGNTGGSAGTAPVLTVERHPLQPMVVDVVATLPDAQAAELVFEADPGVTIEQLAETDPGSRRYRLRGLTPGAAHESALVVGQERYPVSINTLPPLPGFQASFDVDVRGEPAPDYRIFDYAKAPAVGDAGIYVIDAAGRTRWFYPLVAATTINDLAAGVKLLPSGDVLYSDLGKIRVVNELGEVKLEITAAQAGVLLFHHDVIQLPNGNFVAIALELRDIYYPADDETHYVAGDVLVELTPAGEVVWTFKALDKLDPQRKRMDFDAPYYPFFHPDTGQQAKDWSHANGVVHDPVDDSLWLSLRHQDWIVKIDRTSGEVVWRLGEEGDFALVGDRWFYHPHSPELQPDGSMLLYDNGVGNPHLAPEAWRTRPIRLALDTTAMTATIAWQDTQESYVAPIAGDVDRLSNGNFLVLDTVLPDDPSAYLPGRPRLREVNPVTGEWVWVLHAPSGHFAYRAITATRLPGEQ